MQVTGPDGTAYTGTYWTEEGSIYVRASGGKTSDAVRLGRTDETCLAKTVLLELCGHPRVTWAEGWVPEGCKGHI